MTAAETHVDPDVVIVGGGMAGLVVARELARAGRRVEVLEASSHLGGAVRPLTLHGPDGAVTVDGGAESFATRSTAVAELVADLGLSDRIRTPLAAGAWLASPRGCVPLPAGGVLGIPVRAADVARVAGPLAGLRARLDALLPGTAGVGNADEAISLGALVRRRLGRRALRRVVAPVAGGVHSADPDLLDADAVAPGLRAAVRAEGSLMGAAARLRAAAPAGSAVAGLDGGLFTLVDALAADVREHGGRIRTGVRVERAVPSAADGRWRLTLAPTSGAFGESLVLTSDRVVVAADSAAAERLLSPLLPGAGVREPATRGGIRLVTLLLRAPALDVAPRGTGVLVTADMADATGVLAKAMTHTSAKWSWLAGRLAPGTHVVRVSYGHLGASEELEGAPERLALHDASTLLGVRLSPAQLLDSATVDIPAGLPFAAVGHAERMAHVRAAAATVPGLHLAGAWIAGTGLAAVVADARRVAAQITEQPTGTIPE